MDTQNNFIGKTISPEDLFLNRLEDGIDDLFNNDKNFQLNKSSLLYQVSKYLCLGSNAKRVRPRLMFYVAEMLQCPLQKILPAAISAELIHNASLLHDDVIDNCNLRRGKTTVNAIWDNSVAVLGGNFLLSKAFNLLNIYDRQISLMAIAVIEEMAKAAIMEIEIQNDLSGGFDMWQKISLGKTGVLFAWSMKSVAMITNNQYAVEQFADIGHRIGVIFQLVDDLRDFYDNPSLKGRFNDLKNGAISYPIILATQHSCDIKIKIEKLWQKENKTWQEINEIGNKIIQSGALSLANEKLQKEINIVTNLLNPYSSTTYGKKIIYWLNQLCEFAKDEFYNQMA